MKIPRPYLWSAVVCVAVLLAATAVWAQTDVKTTVPPEPVELPTRIKVVDEHKIEAVMFFWYGCGGCFFVDAAVTAWSDSLPDDVRFIRIPAPFNPTWAFHAKIFFALEAMGVKHETHVAAFNAIQVKRIKVKTPEDLPALLSELGVDKKKFMPYFDSPEVAAKLQQAEALMDAYTLEAVPAMVINGKYRFDLDAAAGEPVKFIQIADQLIERERKDAK